jgi:flagellar biosynthesis anti-sigma factor FlgM
VSGKISGVTSNQPASAATGSAGQRAATSAATATSTATATPASSGTGAAGGNASATGSVQITDTASFLATAEQALAEVPVVNQGRLTQISNSLSAGTYKVSPERIANQLLQFERLLPQDSAE